MENYKNSKIGRETAQKYGDILEMERPQTEESLRKHPRMTLQNRAKIFSPFSPLRGYDEQLAAEKQRTERVTKRILTEEEMSALSDRLMQVTKGMTITVRYFKEDTAHPEIPAVGNYVTLTGKADRIRRRQQLETNLPRLAFFLRHSVRVCILCLATLSEKTGRLGYFRRFTSFPRHVDHFEHPA